MDSVEKERHEEVLKCMVLAVYTATKAHPNSVLSVNMSEASDYAPGSAELLFQQALELLEARYVSAGHLRRVALDGLCMVALQEGYDVRCADVMNSYHRQTPYASLRLRVLDYTLMYGNLGRHSTLSASKGFDHVLQGV